MLLLIFMTTGLSKESSKMPIQPNPEKNLPCAMQSGMPVIYWKQLILTSKVSNILNFHFSIVMYTTCQFIDSDADSSCVQLTVQDIKTPTMTKPGEITGSEMEWNDS